MPRARRVGHRRGRARPLGNLRAPGLEKAFKKSSKTNEKTLANGVTAALEEEEYSAVQAAYNMGGMTIAASMYEADNLNGVAAKKYDETELSVSFAF